jgi:tetratricopeptide (TPR) repeat protein
MSGRAADGMPLLEEAVAQTESLGVLVNHSAEVAWLGEAYLLGGRLDQAAELARRSLDLARHHKEKGNLAYALQLTAEIARHRGAAKRTQAGDGYGRALALAKELGMRPLEAQCHLGLARVLRDRGASEAARKHLHTAARMFQEMHMTFWLRNDAELTSFG